MQSTIVKTSRAKNNVLMLAYIAFITLGLPIGLLGVAWPTMRADFGLPLDAMGLLLISTTVVYSLTSFFYCQIDQSVWHRFPADIFQPGFRGSLNRLFSRPGMGRNRGNWRTRRIWLRHHRRRVDYLPGCGIQICSGGTRFRW